MTANARRRKQPTEETPEDGAIVVAVGFTEAVESLVKDGSAKIVRLPAEKPYTRTIKQAQQQRHRAAKRRKR